MGMSRDEERDRRAAFVQWASDVLGPVDYQKAAMLQHIWDYGFKCACKIEIDDRYDDRDFTPCKAFRSDWDRAFRDAHNGMDENEWRAYKIKRIAELEHTRRMLEDEEYRHAHLKGQLP